MRIIRLGAWTFSSHVPKTPTEVNGGFQLTRITGLSLYSAKPDFPKAWQVNTFESHILCLVCLVPLAVAVAGGCMAAAPSGCFPHPNPAPALPAAAQKARSTGWKPWDFLWYIRAFFKPLRAKFNTSSACYPSHLSFPPLAFSSAVLFSLSFHSLP